MNHFDTIVNALASVLSARAARSTVEDGLANLGKTPVSASLEDLQQVLRGQVYKRLQVVMPVSAAGKLVQEIETAIAGAQVAAEAAPKSVNVISSEPYRAPESANPSVIMDADIPSNNASAAIPEVAPKSPDDTRSTLIFDPELLVNSKSVSANLRAISAVSLEFGDVLYAVPEIKQELRSLRRRAESGDQISQAEFDVLSQRMRDQRNSLSQEQNQKLAHYENQLDQLEGMGKRSAEMDLRFESARRMLESGMLATADIKQLEEKLRAISPAFILDTQAPGIETDEPMIALDPRTSVELSTDLIDFGDATHPTATLPAASMPRVFDVEPPKPVASPVRDSIIPELSTEEHVVPKESEIVFSPEPTHESASIGLHESASIGLHEPTSIGTENTAASLDSAFGNTNDLQTEDSARFNEPVREHSSSEQIFSEHNTTTKSTEHPELAQPTPIQEAVETFSSAAFKVPEPIESSSADDLDMQRLNELLKQTRSELLQENQGIAETPKPTEHIPEITSEVIYEHETNIEKPTVAKTISEEKPVEEKTSEPIKEIVLPTSTPASEKTPEPEPTHTEEPVTKPQIIQEPNIQQPIAATQTSPPSTPPPMRYEPLFPSNQSSGSTPISNNPYGDWSRDRFLKSTPSSNEVRMNMSENTENETPTSPRSSSETITRVSLADSRTNTGSEESAILLARSRRDAASRNAERMRADPMAVKPDQMQSEQKLTESDAALVASRLEAKLQTVQASHAKLESGLGMRVAQSGVDLAHKSLEAVRLQEQYGAVTGAAMEHARLELERAQEDINAARMFEKVTVQTPDTNEPSMPSVRLDHEQLQSLIGQTPRMLAARHALERAELNLAIKDNPYSPAVDVSAAKELVEMASERLNTLQTSMRADLEASLAEIRFTHAESVRHEQSWRRASEELRQNEDRLAAGQISVLARDESHLRAVRAEHDYRTSVHRHIEAIHRIQVLVNSDLQNA